MKKNNNKGFSLIEILATMVILAIVSTIGIVSVNRLIRQSKDHFYESQQQQMVLAAQSYANDSRNILPRNVGGMIKVKLSTLRDKNYIKEDIVDQDKKPCDKENSYVTIYKSNRSDYKYKGYLECPACREGNSSACYSPDEKTKPYITISFTPFNNSSQGNALFEDDKNITIKMFSLKDPTSNPDIKIASYSYKIYVNNELKFDSGTKIDNKRTNFTITESVIKYIPGTIKVVATVTNTDGSTTSKTDSYNYNDAHVPLCGRITYEGHNAMTAYDSQTNPAPVCGTTGYKWINIGNQYKNRITWILCNDVKGIGCAQHEFSQAFYDDGHDDKINIRDKNGKSYDCTVKKCIDKTTPKIVVSFYKATSGGGTSGNAVKTYTTSPQQKDFVYKQTAVYEKWLNKENYPNGVVVKVKTEDETSKIKSFTWKINPKNQNKDNVTDANTTIKTKADLSGGKTEYWINEDGVRKLDVSVVDNAGNTARFILTLWLDKTPPPVPTISMYKEDNTRSESTDTKYSNDKWTKKYVWVNTNKPKDDPNVSGWDRNEYNTSGAHGTLKKQKGRDVHINEEGTSYVSFRSCDKAENCSDFVSPHKIIKEDRTAPKISFSVTASGGTYGSSYKKYVTIKISCSDSYSGVDKFTVDGNNATNPSSYKRDTRGTLTKKAYCEDELGNHSTVTKSYTVVKYQQSCDNCGCGGYSYYWYSCDKGYDDTDQNCTTKGGTMNGISCNSSTVGTEVASGNHHATCCQGDCNSCASCWY